jgi:hypothetical protein
MGFMKISGISTSYGNKTRGLQDTGAFVTLRVGFRKPFPLFDLNYYKYPGLPVGYKLFTYTPFSTIVRWIAEYYFHLSDETVFARHS